MPNVRIHVDGHSYLPPRQAVILQEAFEMFAASLHHLPGFHLAFEATPTDADRNGPPAAPVPPEPQEAA